MRRPSPSFILTCGLLAGCLALAALCLQATVLNARRVEATASTLTSDHLVRTALQQRLVAAIGTRIPAAQGGDPATVNRIAASTLDQPQFVQAFRAGLGQLHAEVFDGATGTITLDPALVTAAARSAVTQLAPNAAPYLGAGTSLQIAIDTNHVPDLMSTAHYVRTISNVTLLIAAVLIAAGFALDEHRAQALGRIGRWALVAALFFLLVFWVIPRTLMAGIGGWAEVAGTVMDGDALVLPLLGLALVGAVLIFASGRWQSASRKQVLSVIPTDPRRHLAPGDRTFQQRV